MASSDEQDIIQENTGKFMDVENAVHALRQTNVDMQDALKRRSKLLREISEWMGNMGFDGHGAKLHEKIKKELWPELVKEEADDGEE